MTEDYTKAKTLAAFTLHGVAFRVVRRRLNGKHWRGYLELLGPGNVLCGGSQFVSGSATEAAQMWSARLAKTFTCEKAILEAIEGLPDKCHPTRGTK